MGDNRKGFMGWLFMPFVYGPLLTIGLCLLAVSMKLDPVRSEILQGALQYCGFIFSAPAFVALSMRLNPSRLSKGGLLIFGFVVTAMIFFVGFLFSELFL